jgi:hypothetical protein
MIVMISRRVISDAVAALMVDSPIISLGFPSGLKPLAPGLPQTQSASIQREAQGSGRESLQRFWTFGPEHGPGPAQGLQRSVRAAVGSADPRKIDSTWHIPPVSRKRELGLSQLTRVMYAVWEEMARKYGSRTDCKCCGKFPVPASPGLSQRGGIVLL